MLFRAEERYVNTEVPCCVHGRYSPPSATTVLASRETVRPEASRGRVILLDVAAAGSLLPLFNRIGRTDQLSRRGLRPIWFHLIDRDRDNTRS
jgi:hypothetical protein